MRFALGIVLGLGIGFAGAILFAPEKKSERQWPPRRSAGNPPPGGNHGSENGLKGFMESVKQRLDEAMSEAKEAQKRAEREMIERYERAVGRKPKP